MTLSATSFNEDRILAKIGFPATGIIALDIEFEIGRRRVAKPAAGMTTISLMILPFTV